MQIINFVTGNGTKVLHANEVLKRYGFEAKPVKLDIIEPREEDPEKVVYEKATQAFSQLNEPLIVEDAGIFIEALNGFPKTFIHFVEDSIGVSNILKMMEGVENRSAEFRQSLAYFAPEMDIPKIFSYVDGGYKIVDRVFEPENPEIWGNFDKILIPPGETKALCMFTKEENARRDAENNKGKIHYEQLAEWLVVNSNIR